MNTFQEIDPTTLPVGARFVVATPMAADGSLMDPVYFLPVAALSDRPIAAICREQGWHAGSIMEVTAPRISALTGQETRGPVRGVATRRVTGFDAASGWDDREGAPGRAL